MSDYRQPVKQLMKRHKVLDIKELDSVAKAIELMDQCDVSALPVRDTHGAYSGVISRTDIASVRFLNALKTKGTPNTILVRDVMNRTSPLYVMEDATIQHAIATMHRRRVHRLFVADANMEMCGVISTTDILRLLVVS